MYDFIRRTHLFSGLLVLQFLMMYFVTGYIVYHEKQFPRSEPSKSSTSLSLAGMPATSDSAFVGRLASALDVRGKLDRSERAKDGSWKLVWSRPGHRYEATVTPAGDRVTLTTTRAGIVGVIHGLHRQHGYGGGLLYDAWAVVYDIAAASLIVFALSGIYLWMKHVSTKWPGAIVLGAGLALTVATILHFMLSK